jgi:hypothetical protein
MKVKRILMTATACLGAALLGGCASLGVQPWKRDLQARADMQPDATDAAVDDHV